MILTLGRGTFLRRPLVSGGARPEHKELNAQRVVIIDFDSRPEPNKLTVTFAHQRPKHTYDYNERAF